MDRKYIASELLILARELLGMDFPTQDAMDKYLKDHPGANRSKHRVKKDPKDETSDEVEERLKKEKGPAYRTQEQRMEDAKPKHGPAKEPSSEKADRIPVPKFDDIKPSPVSDKDKEELVDVNYRASVKMLGRGESLERRLKEILAMAKKRSDEIKTTLKQWEVADTMPKNIVDGWKDELGRLPYQIRGIEKALEEHAKK